MKMKFLRKSCCNTQVLVFLVSQVLMMRSLRIFLGENHLISISIQPFGTIFRTLFNEFILPISLRYLNTTDLILVGEWMSPKFLKYQNGAFTEIEQEKITGLWQTIEAFDIDHDGDTDYLLGNWGTNSKFNASKESPMKLYFNDFDNNGQTETVTAMEKNGNYYPLETLDGLASQMVYLKKKYTTYRSFAGNTIEEIFGEDVLEASTKLEVNTLKSGCLRNDNDNFVFVPFKN